MMSEEQIEKYKAVSKSQRAKIKAVLKKMIKSDIDNQLTISETVDANCLSHNDVTVDFYWQFTELEPVYRLLAGDEFGVFDNLWWRILNRKVPPVKKITSTELQSMLELYGDDHDLSDFSGMDFLGDQIIGDGDNERID